jgi:hypothetical protein
MPIPNPTGYRYVKTWRQNGVTFRYFARNGLPRLRMRGEPGSPEFEVLYKRALAVGTPAEMQALRAELGMVTPRRREDTPGGVVDYERGDAIMAWACKEAMTARQVELVMRALGLSHEEATKHQWVGLRS